MSNRQHNFVKYFVFTYVASYFFKRHVHYVLLSIDILIYDTVMHNTVNTSSRLRVPTYI